MAGTWIQSLNGYTIADDVGGELRTANVTPLGYTAFRDTGDLSHFWMELKYNEQTFYGTTLDLLTNQDWNHFEVRDASQSPDWVAQMSLGGFSASQSNLSTLQTHKGIKYSGSADPGEAFFKSVELRKAECTSF